jgi:hypothetical protein
LKDIWNAQHIDIALKVIIYKTAVLSILLYDCESWTMTKCMDTEVDGFNTNCMRVILNIKRTDMIPNADSSLTPLESGSSVTSVTSCASRRATSQRKLSQCTNHSTGSAEEVDRN